VAHRAQERIARATLARPPCPTEPENRPVGRGIRRAFRAATCPRKPVASDGDETSIGFHEAKDVRAAVSYARELPGRPGVIAYGVSMGSAAILKAEADGRLGARALILECPFDRLLTAVDHRFAERRVPAFPLSRLLVFWGGWRQGFDGFAHNLVDYARDVRTPVLLIAGEEDPLVTPEETASIVQALAANGQLFTCPGIGHAPCSRGPADLWRHRVGQFIDRTLATPERDPGAGD
jgi:pimeloyl-ACP methyl ester carboxylesterase